MCGHCHTVGQHDMLQQCKQQENRQTVTSYESASEEAPATVLNSSADPDNGSFFRLPKHSRVCL
jgi:hypothetical protein